MRFIVTYRDRSGSKATELIKAETRVECFAECRRLGITPMSVQQQAEVSNKCERISAHATVQLKKNIFNKGFLFCIFISLLIASILAWLWLSQSDAPISITQIPNKIKKDVRFKNIKPIENVTAKPVNSDAISLPKMSRVKHPVTGESLIITQKAVKLLPNASRIGTVFTNNLFKPPKCSILTDDKSRLYIFDASCSLISPSLLISIFFELIKYDFIKFLQQYSLNRYFCISFCHLWCLKLLEKNSYAKGRQFYGLH